VKHKRVVVISLGGSFLFAHADALKTLKNTISKSNSAFVILVGGGKLARDYIEFGRSLGIGGNNLHKIGIKSTRLNAFIISVLFSGKYYEGDPRKIKTRQGILVSGGYAPGWTTDVCSAYACIAAGAGVLFNISKERGVYNKDPDVYKSARLLNNISFDELYKLTSESREPGMNYIFDPMAGRICQKNKIDVVVTSDIKDIDRYFEGRKVSGTLINSSRRLRAY